MGALADGFLFGMGFVSGWCAVAALFVAGVYAIGLFIEALDLP